MPYGELDRFQRFFQCSSDCQIYLERSDDGRFRYLHANPKALQLAGTCSEEDIIGRTPVEVLGPNYGAAVEANILAAYNQRRPYRFKGRLVSDEEGPVYEATYYPMFDAEDNVVAVCGTARDVSDVATLNESLVHLEKLEVVGEMASGIIHDFHNTIAAMQAMLSLLDKDHIEPSRRKRILMEGQKTLDNVIALTGRMNSFVRKEKIEPIPHDVDTLVRGCIDMLVTKLGRSTRLSVHSEPDLWRARCSEHEFEVALLNLASNARDAVGKSGHVEISLRNGSKRLTDPDHFPQHYVEVRMSDDGVGIAPELLDKVTTPFFTTKPAGKGTGLGLSGVWKFVHDIGGALRIQSEIGVGTAVSMLLPKVKDD